MKLKLVGTLAAIGLILGACGGESSSKDITTTPSMGSVAAPDTEAAHTGDLISCNGELVLVDTDGDGWGSCVAVSTTTTSAPNGDIKILAIGSGISTDPALRDTLKGLITSASSSIRSLDLLDFQFSNEGTATMQLAITSGYNGIEYRDDVAWELVSRGLATLWAADGQVIFRNDNGKIRVSLSLMVDSTRYEATYDQMVQVADSRISSVDWLNSTRR